MYMAHCEFAIGARSIAVFCLTFEAIESDWTTVLTIEKRTMGLRADDNNGKRKANEQDTCCMWLSPKLSLWDG